MDLIEAVRQRKDYQQLIQSLESRACKLTGRAASHAGLTSYRCEAHGKTCHPWGAKKGAKRELNTQLSPAPFSTPAAVSEILEMLRVPRSHFKDFDKQVARLAKDHPLWRDFGTTIRGLGAINFALIVSEIEGRSFASPAKLWKYFGLGMYMGEIQHRTRDREKAIGMAYCVPRRVTMYNASLCLMKLNDGEYRQLYLERKSYRVEQGWTKGHAHNDALRYIAKRLLRNLWRVTRDHGRDDSHRRNVPALVTVAA